MLGRDRGGDRALVTLLLFLPHLPCLQVRWDAKSTHEFLDNYKVLQQLFEKKGIDKYLGECRARAKE